MIEARHSDRFLVSLAH